MDAVYRLTKVQDTLFGSFDIFETPFYYVYATEVSLFYLFRHSSCVHETKVSVMLT
jgi:hypothetical protein